MSNIKNIFIILLAFFVTSCSTANHSAFIVNTYIDKNKDVQGEYIGTAVGESQQKWMLYLFPIGEAPSTHDALENALQRFSGTKYLSDVAIDNRITWKFGYYIQIINVQGDAYK
jgi:hypothetical protein